MGGGFCARPRPFGDGKRGGSRRTINRKAATLDISGDWKEMEQQKVTPGIEYLEKNSDS